MEKNGDHHKGNPTTVEQLQEKPKEFLIIGIGASAGGIQALQEFFRHVPENSNMAFVVILHLSPDHDSQLSNILQQETPVPVLQVTERTLIKPNHIYVVPPNRHLTMEDGYIAVSPNLHIEERRAPVDIFFRTLADQHGPRAISVILSGTGANGSMGLKRVKERGGATYVQNPREAEFNDMPRNAIATELVDEVLNVKDIPARIIAYRDGVGAVEIIEENEKRPEPQMRREIREMILFANHNFLKDSPFSKLDLVTCRNVLIYLNNTAQERVIETFHFALKPKKFLFLGTSESVDGASDLYALYNRDHHIYKTREVAPRSYPVPDSVPQFLLSKIDMLQKSDERESHSQRMSFGELHQRMLEQYAPPSVVVNEEYEIVHMTERAGKYFEFSGGEPTQNLLKLINPQIRLELRSALYQAVQNKTAVEARNVKLVVNSQPHPLDIHVRPVLEEGDTARGFILVIFKPAEEASQQGATVMVASDEPVARKLEEELIGLKMQLRNSIEHHEYQAEELKASNEELQAMNEELRSAAEELETSKEELQSINEELRTVNQELKVKVEETSISSNNLQNLINSASVGTIFLDRNFEIRLFTPAILEIFNLKMGDYGRPVTDITNKLQYDGLLQDAETVLEKLTLVEREVRTSDNRFFMMRLLPNRTSEDRINGVVITFFDITRRRESEEALRQSEERMRLLIESAKDYAIFTTDTERRVDSWSSGAQLIFGYSESEIVGKTGDILFVPEDRDSKVPEEEVRRAGEEGRAENERWHLRKDGSRFWGSGTTQPLSDEQGNALGYVKIMRDLTDQRRMQEALRQSEEYYRTQLEQEVEARTVELRASKEQYLTLVENTPDVITRWDRDLKLVFANTAFKRKTDPGNESLFGRSSSVPGQPDKYDAAYMESLREAFETGETVEHFSSFDTSEGEVYFYSRLTPEKNASGEFETVLAIARDITEIKKAEREVKENQELLQATLDSSLNMIQVFKAKRDDSGKIVDFTWVMNNATSEKMYGEVRGQNLLEQNPEVIGTGIFDHFVEVTETGKPQQYEKYYTYKQFAGWFHQSVVKLNDGVATSTLDITDRKLAEIALKESRDLLQSILDNSFIAMSVLKAVRDESGAIADFEIRLTNQELNRETGRSDLVGKRCVEEFPGLKLSGLFDVMLRVVSTGQAEGLEYFYPYDGFNKWYSCVFVKMDDGLVAINLDISERKHAEQYVRNSEEQLRMFVTASSDLIFQMNADWSKMYTLQRENFLSKTEAPTEMWMDRYIPPDERQKVQAAIDQAVQNKQVFELQHRVILSNGHVGWANSRAVPLLNEEGEILEWFGVATDITARKTSDEERYKNYLLLQQSEDVANTGTWDYDLLTGTLKWSDGMYRLFNLQKGEKISLRTYMQYASGSSQNAAALIAGHIERGDTEFEEILRIRIENAVKVLKMKATVIKDDAGRPVRVLGVDMDVTASREAEDRLRQMAAERQQEIFRVTLRTQEEERRRISESLHNGLGQLLFGIKISMNHLNREEAMADPEKYESSRKYTEELLVAAIRESRKISHELMPTTLEQFGLRSAIEDVCKQLNGGVTFRCQFKGPAKRFEKYLELAVFRTVQELMLNVVKHADATSGTVLVSIRAASIQISVSDNGKGMLDIEETESGIGLSSIRSKIKLLNGTMKINSVNGSGTEVTVTIPISAQEIL